MIRIEKKLLGGMSAEDFAAYVARAYETRREERKPYELQWQLNMNFIAGNQYCFVTPRGDIADEYKDYEWQSREVYNHLAPIFETRLAKLSRVRPRMSVIPASGDDTDVLTAKTATAVLDSATAKLGFDAIVAEATQWAEACGTVFYKVTWDGSDACVTVVPPFELYPDSDAAGSLDDCASVIHARAVGAGEVRDAYGIDAQGRDIGVFSADGIAGLADSRLLSVPKHDQVMLYEYYERPTADYPDGRFAIVADNVLAYLGALPYCNATDGGRGYPFVPQVSVRRTGCLWGASVIERAIPVQRAYNAVKNRKHEFLNRLAGGVLAVEDGSVDIEDLAADGLTPGKVIVYRQGSTPPRFLDTGRLPHELAQEEDKLLSEFIAISGVSELMRSSTVAHSVNSGVALQMLIEQDDTRLAVTAELVKTATKRVAAQILRLYKQFATVRRMARVVGEDGAVEMTAWNASDITSDDVAFVSENQLSDTPAQNRQFVFELLKTGLLADEDGKISDRMRTKLLDIVGFGMREAGKDVESLQIKRARAEMLEARAHTPVVKPYDDHAVHVAEHTKYLLGGDFARAAARDPALEAVIVRHLETHRELAAQGEKHEENS